MLTMYFDSRAVDLRPAGGRVHVVTAQQRTFVSDAVVCAVGFVLPSVSGVPLTDDSLAVANRNGAVVGPDTQESIPGLYVVGWAKRGAQGGIGENRRCAAETVD